jgi:hypothetical protein
MHDMCSNLFTCLDLFHKFTSYSNFLHAFLETQLSLCRQRKTLRGHQHLRLFLSVIAPVYAMAKLNHSVNKLDEAFATSFYLL